MAFSSNSGGGPMADINVTPLVDVMLVLLIIFIITAPLMAHKVQVKLPEANIAQKDNANKEKTPPITISVQEDGSVYLNDEKVNMETLKSRLSVAAQKTPQPPLNLRGDRTTKMKYIKEIMQAAQEQGMLDIGFVATKDRGN